MSEKPNLIFAALLAATAAAACSLAAALIVTGACDVGGAASLIGAAAMDCFFFVEHAHRVPLSWLALLALVVASLISCLRTLRRGWRSERLLARLPLERVAEGRLAEIAVASGTRLYLTPAKQPAAFCAGLVRPRIVISSGLLEALAVEEQAAAVWHEAHHARQREPLKCLVGRLAATAFFWLPLLRDLLERYLLAKELAADRLAIRQVGLPALAGALFAAAPAPTGALGLTDLASARVARLADPQAKLPPLFCLRHLLATGAGVLSLLILFAMPWAVDVDPAHLRSLLETLF